MSTSCRRVILLRSIDQAQEMVDLLAPLSVKVIHCPMIEMLPNKKAFHCITADFINSFTTLIFTSANGVKFFFADLQQKGIDVRTLANKKIFSVGPKTQQCLERYGCIPDGLPDIFVAESLLELFGKDLRAQKILIPTALGARSVLSQELTARGAKVHVLKIYRTIRPKIKPILIQNGDLVLFTSPSTAKHFFTSKLYKNQSIVAFCIGDVTKKAVSTYISGNICVSKQATAASLVHAVATFLGKDAASLL